MSTLKLRNDLLLNVGFALLNLGALLYLTRLSTAGLAPAALGLFILLRRYSATGSSLLQLGATTAFLRYSGVYHDQPKLLRFFGIQVFLLFLLVSGLLGVFSFFFLDQLALFLGTGSESARWVGGVCLLLIVQQLLLFVPMNWLLVERRMILYNLYSIAVSSGFYILLFLLLPEVSVSRVFSYYCLLCGALLLVGNCYYVVLPLLRSGPFPWARSGEIWKEMLGYGLPRCAISFLDNLLYVLPAWLIRHDEISVARFLCVMLFVQVSGLIVLPVNQLSMVVSARFAGKSAANMQQLCQGASLLFEALVVLSLTTIALGFPLSDLLYRFTILDSELLAGIEAYTLLLLAVLPLCLFNGLKGIIEVYWKQPYNLYNLALANLLGMACFMLAIQTQPTDRAVIAAFLLTVFSLGGSTLYRARRFLTLVNWRVLGSASLLLLAAYWLNEMLRHSLGGAPFELIVRIACAALSALVIVGSWAWPRRDLLRG